MRSSTDRPYHPTVSRVIDDIRTPSRLTRFQVGLRAYIPLNDAGRMCEPPVCVPNASGTWKSPTAAPEPDDEPPGVCAWLYGLRVSALRPPEANSTVSVLPRMSAPAPRTTATQAASRPTRIPS